MTLLVNKIARIGVNCGVSQHGDLSITLFRPRVQAMNNVANLAIHLRILFGIVKILSRNVSF